MDGYPSYDPEPLDFDTLAEDRLLEEMLYADGFDPDACETDWDFDPSDGATADDSDPLDF